MAAKNDAMNRRGGIRPPIRIGFWYLNCGIQGLEKRSEKRRAANGHGQIQGRKENFL
jgi:hypothetical protein